MDFEEIASSSLSHTSSKTTYDVFINHRGDDVKLTTASIIYHMLRRSSVNVFLDKKSLQLGDVIPTELEQVIKTASIHIAIFSKGYAESPWCLSELSLMLKTGAPIIPVFYGVKPYDLRYVAKGIGIYAEAFSQHEMKARYKPEILKEWKKSLKEMSYRNGCNLEIDNDEGVLLDNILDRVSLEMKKKKAPLDVAKHPVGLDVAVQRFEKHILETAKDGQTVQFVGIVGLGGSGKTTLAKALYNQKRSLMKGSSFVFNVRDSSNNERLCKLQEKLLSDIVGHSDWRFDNISEGKALLASHIGSVRMLIVLDDVDREEQLDALLPDKESFQCGSLIIVTGRDFNVLQRWGISSIFQMELLNLEHAKQLFCCHAFPQSEPCPEFEDLVTKFVAACHGPPLSLTFFGRMVRFQDRDRWMSKLDSVLRKLPGDIVEVLEVSYDSLEEEKQQMFLDTACFFIGEKKSLAIEVWDREECSGREGLETLVNKCLVELDQHERIRMHHHLSDLGQKIATKSSPYRIWLAEQIKNIRTRSELRFTFSFIHVTDDYYYKKRMLFCLSYLVSVNFYHVLIQVQIRGIIAAKTQFDGISPHQELTISAQCWPPFEECMELLKNTNREYKRFRLSLLLELLVVVGEQFVEKFAELSVDLVWLRWFDFRYRHLPSWMSLRKLRVLELCGALNLEELWTDNPQGRPSHLRELTIAANSGHSFDRFPSSISHLKCLKKMVLVSRRGDEFGFTSLPEEFCELEKLEHLELRCCRALSSLPTKFGDLKELQHLYLCACHSLSELPSSFNQLINLECLDLSDCWELRVPSDILEKMKKLEKLFFSGCRKLEALPSHITDQKCLRELHLVDTQLREVPSSLSQLSKLETLKIGSPCLTTIPDSLYCLPSLTHLSFRDCNSLYSLPNCINPSTRSQTRSQARPQKGLAQLQHFCIESSKVSTLQLLTFCNLTNLQTLKISHCPISELCLRPGSLINLKVINLTKTLVRGISISEECCRSLELFNLIKMLI